MPIEIVERLPVDPVSTRARVDPLAWCVRVALLLLVSPALFLVLVFGSLLLLVQFVSSGWKTLSGKFLDIRTSRPSDPAEPSVVPGATAMGSAALASRDCRDHLA